MTNWLSAISKLRQELVQLGYQDYQIDQIIADELGVKEAGTLADKRAQQVIEVLSSYLEFARKCHHCR